MSLYSGGEPVVLETGRVVSLAEASEIMELDPIIKRFGTWAVTEYGVECLTSHYPIEKARLGEMDWHEHMIAKNWTVADDVCAALDYARGYFKSKPQPAAPREIPSTPGLARRPRPCSDYNKLAECYVCRSARACTA